MQSIFLDQSGLAMWLDSYGILMICTDPDDELMTSNNFEVA